MKTILRPLTLALAMMGAGVALAPRDAQACGGCFAPPDAVQVVTDHRMVLSLSTTQTTLWDQFQYSGRPEDFSWILPIRYTDATRVQLASDDFLTLLFNVMAPVLTRPAPPPFPPGCEPPYDTAVGGFADAGASPAPQDAASAADSGVTVLREEVVGPYAVVILRSTSGMGLRDWLRMNGYTIPAATEPVIDHYLGLEMDFIALRLRAGEGLNRMVPVRVTLDGYQPSLPLRMIAAGVADRVGLSLTVIAPSRIEAMNFPNGELTNDDFTYDWNAPVTDLPSAYLNAFNVMNRAQGQRVWLTESSLPQQRLQIRSLAERLPRRAGFDDGGMPSATAADDVDVAFTGLGETATFTRMRADLPAAMLDRDLQLGASDRGMRDRFYTFGVERNRPMYSACPWPARDGGTIPTDFDAGVGTGPVGNPAVDAGASNSLAPAASSGGLQCATTAPGLAGRGGAALALGVALGALVAVRRKRR
ncbi:MAG: DUF2330 domain-containing protein [Polyangiales bacterium]